MYYTIILYYIILDTSYNNKACEVYQWITGPQVKGGEYPYHVI
jgi:hypothetical protein